MKIQEFRNVITKADRKDLERIAAELYKQIPKAKKESEADILINDILSHKESAGRKTPGLKVDFPALKSEIDVFLDRVDENLYFAPNRIVPKSKRSKWRFEVKAFVKQLDQIPIDGSDAKEAADLYLGLYKRLCKGCGYYIFPTEDPFRAVGIPQTVFYEKLVRKTFATGYTDENLDKMLQAAALVNLDRETLHIQLEILFVSLLPTPDLKKKAIGIARGHVEKYEALLSRERPGWSNTRFELESNIEEMCETILCLGISLCEGTDAVEYYWTHNNRDIDKEVTLYKILDTIELTDGRGTLWRNTYEEAVSLKRITPRDFLKEEYQKMLSGDHSTRPADENE